MMMCAGEVYEHPYERLVVRVGTAESQGRELVAEVSLPGGSPGVPPHIHPQLEESFTVISGELDFLTPDGTWKNLWPGDHARIPPMTVHSFRPHAQGVRVLVEIRPGARFEEMWRQFMGMAQDGKLGPAGDHLPFLQAMAMIREFPDVMALAGPPIFLQHAFAAVLAPLARLRGYKGKYEEYLRRGPSEIVELETLPV